MAGKTSPALEGPGRCGGTRYIRFLPSREGGVTPRCWLGPPAPQGLGGTWTCPPGRARPLEPSRRGCRLQSCLHTPALSARPRRPGACAEPPAAGLPGEPWVSILRCWKGIFYVILGKLGGAEGALFPKNCWKRRCRFLSGSLCQCPLPQGNREGVNGLMALSLLSTRPVPILIFFSDLGAQWRVSGIRRAEAPGGGRDGLLPPRKSGKVAC